MAAASGNRHRITGPTSDDALVVAGPKSELLVLDYLGAIEARDWHHKLIEQREPHSWQVNDGGPTGWNSVAAYFVSAEAREPVLA